MPAPSEATLFDTAIGRCGMSWGEGGIDRILLPEHNEAATLARLAPANLVDPDAAPEPVREAIALIRAHLDGESVDMGQIELDTEGIAPIDLEMLECLRATGPGETLTYGDLAARIGRPGAARAIGQALGRNRFPIVVPCHRVLASGGRPGGFSAPGGLRTKQRLLDIEAGRTALAGAR